jgi:hypothetical protein
LKKTGEIKGSVFRKKERRFLEIPVSSQPIHLRSGVPVKNVTLLVLKAPGNNK